MLNLMNDSSIVSSSGFSSRLIVISCLGVFLLEPICNKEEWKSFNDLVLFQDHRKLWMKMRLSFLII